MTQQQWHLRGRFCKPSAPVHSPQLAAAGHALQVRISAHLTVEVCQHEALEPRSSRAQRTRLDNKMDSLLCKAQLRLDTRFKAMQCIEKKKRQKLCAARTTFLSAGNVRFAVRWMSCRVLPEGTSTSLVPSLSATCSLSGTGVPHTDI